MSKNEARTHAWHVEARECRRQEQRRGRRFACNSLHPARTVPVVVDMVPFFVDADPCCRGIVPNIQSLADRLRAAGGTVAWAEALALIDTR
ncbi:hypothetical protein [Streptomyces sp. H51]|uniref:hypothetical protein n=1 Tax=Streptomyces sp. H51 TaxID=3111770 RepID=UPI002D7966E5|nr:hypothetical protein [Streptomyces sp. H51]